MDICTLLTQNCKRGINKTHDLKLNKTTSNFPSPKISYLQITSRVLIGNECRSEQRHALTLPGGMKRKLILTLKNYIFITQFFISSQVIKIIIFFQIMTRRVIQARSNLRLNYSKRKGAGGLVWYQMLHLQVFSLCNLISGTGRVQRKCVARYPEQDRVVLVSG